MSSATLLGKLIKAQKAAAWYVLLVVGLPLITLVILGLVMLWQNNWLILISAIWLTATLAGYALYRLWPEPLAGNARKNNPDSNGAILDSAEISDAYAESVQERNDTNPKTPLPVRLEPRSDWTTLDQRVWLRAVEAIELTLKEQSSWEELPEMSLTMLSAVSEYYNVENQRLVAGPKDKKNAKPEKIYSFTLPEILLVLSITSSRYRQLVLDYIPFADKIKVSSLLSLYARQDQIKSSARWINNIRRTTRFINPLAAITAELRDQFTNRIFTNLSDKVQHDLKRLLLQELVQVAMDLYSGRLKNSSEELAQYRSTSVTKDADRQAIPVEPLRIVLAGQLSSGKSSLVNALINRLEAETDILPSTHSQTVHSLHWRADEIDENDAHAQTAPLHLIDTIGLGDSTQTLDSFVDNALQADLLVWVARANQPARAVDVTHYEALQKALAGQSMRRQAPILLVVTHIDQLKPKAIWQPPYDLNSRSGKGLNIRQAIESCKHQLGFPDPTPVVPVCLSDAHDPYNVDMVAAQIMLLRADASQTQLNRRRVEQINTGTSWHDRWNQASKLGTVSGKILVRSVLDQSQQ